MSRNFLHSIYCIALLVVTAVNAQNLEAELQQKFEDLDLMGMSLSINHDGETTNVAFGIRDFERNLPVTEDTEYRIASISKSFTALGLLKLVNDAEVSLDDDISIKLGYSVRNPQFPNTPITYRMLLSHTSSLQDGSGYGDFLNATYSQTPIPNIAQVLLPGGNYYTSNMWRTETPGTYFTYSNINFGLIGTLIEAISGERFDVFMKSEILEPLTIAGSFNIQDLENINDLAAIYRYFGGSWNVQWDNYQGVLPSPPDLSNYTPGTNGVYFAPQGGLRISTTDTDKFLDFLQNNGDGFALNLSQETFDEMKSVQWDYNGSNGDNYFGLFNRWGLGIQHANVTSGDQICGLQDFPAFKGHPGEAYGLISDAYFIDETDIRFTFITNGSQNGYTVGNDSSFYTVEEEIFSVLCNYFSGTLSTKKEEAITVTISPNPVNDFIEVSSAKLIESYKIFDLQGKIVKQMDSVQQANFRINNIALQSGVYFLKLNTDQNSVTKKISIN